MREPPPDWFRKGLRKHTRDLAKQVQSYRLEMDDEREWFELWDGERRIARWEDKDHPVLGDWLQFRLFQPLCALAAYALQEQAKNSASGKRSAAGRLESRDETEFKKDKAKRMRAEGKSVKEIARALKTSTSYVYEVTADKNK